MSVSTLGTAVPDPYIGYSEVKPGWLDANGHMNVGHYVSAFDDGSCPLFDDIGLGWHYTAGGEFSIFMVSSSIDFRRELVAGAPLEMTTRLLGYDRRRIHLYQELFHREQRYLAAQAEFVFVHVSLATRGVVNIPDAALNRLDEIRMAHADFARPAFVGRSIGLEWKPRS
ncbi:MAG: acyl-CoA thioesterase [Gammaproteobacteria bacterium]